MHYWVFIIPENVFIGLWERCVNENCVAMECPPHYHGCTRNIEKVNQIKEADWIVAYLNQNTIGGFGKVTKTLYDAKEEDKYPHGSDGFRQRIGVKWEKVDLEGWHHPGMIKDLIGIPPSTLLAQTIHKLPQVYFENVRQFIEEKENLNMHDLDEEADVEESKALSMVLSSTERQVLGFLVANIEQLEKGLRILNTDVRTNVGTIDILAKDTENRSVVIDVTTTEVGDKALIRLLGCMGSLAKQKTGVIRGILVAPSLGRRIRSALAVLPTVSFRPYSMTLQFPDTRSD
ncbi:MAG: endonuclease NucS domain-containing protein [Candidatus Heimdallarchaeota archaeon]